MKNKVSVSFLKSNKSLQETIEEINQTDADYIHVDIMDGIFVENKTLSIDDVLELANYAKKPLDIHLMVDNPVEYIEAFKNLNVAYITIHEELDKDKDELIDLIHSYGLKAGLAINPETNVEDIGKYISKVEYVLIMGVNPGYGGQELIFTTPIKIDVLNVLLKNEGYHYEISFDGGVNEETKRLLYGLDCVVSGSFICLSDNYQEKIDCLRILN